MSKFIFDIIENKTKYCTIEWFILCTNLILFYVLVNIESDSLICFNTQAKEWIPERKDLVIGRYVVKKTKSRVVSVNRRMSTIGVTIQV